MRPGGSLAIRAVLGHALERHGAQDRRQAHDRPLNADVLPLALVCETNVVALVKQANLSIAVSDAQRPAGVIGNDADPEPPGPGVVRSARDFAGELLVDPLPLANDQDPVV